ncbi:MAG: hypothetical protein LBH95_10210 [Oscillospiraceae bacterium]|jgi:hypothetical protein|nr:hypothetical protein [Oscillospiraceae bacterium]
MDTYHIPANYTKAGRLFGLFEIRNTVEAVLIAVPILFLSFTLLPFGLTVKCVAAMILAIPCGGFVLTGLQDDCLSRFLRGYFRWRNGRKELRYRPAGSLGAHRVSEPGASVTGERKKC